MFSHTRDQIVARYDRLKKADTVKFPDGISKTLVEVSKMTLDMFSVNTAMAASATVVPAAGDVEEFIKSVLSFPFEVFTENFFRSPLSATVSLYEVAKLYGCQVH